MVLAAIGLLTTTVPSGAIAQGAVSPVIWTQDQTLAYTETDVPETEYGDALDADADRAVVGVPGIQAAQILERNAWGWEPTALLEPGDPVGRSVAIDGDRVALGAPGSDAVHVYRLTDEGWTHEAQLTGPSDDPADGLGFAVALDGDRLVASPGEAFVAVYEHDGQEWVREARLDAPSGANDFGREIDVSGDTVAVTEQSFREGTAYVYEETQDGWVRQATLTPPDGAVGFGRGLALDGGMLAVGAPWSFPAPIVAVYERTGGAWTMVENLTPSDLSPDASGSGFGTSIDVAGDDVLVGAPREDYTPGSPVSPPHADRPCMGLAVTTSCPQPGAAYHFAEQEGGWTQQAKLSAVEGTPKAAFGAATAFTDEGALIGSPWAGNIANADRGFVHSFRQTVLLEG